MNDTLSADDRPLEIERKYLIEYPDMEWLTGVEGLQIVNICQYYYDTDTEKKLRIRRWEEAGTVKFFFTKKTRITDMVRIEEEREISEAEFKELLEAPAENRRSIGKIRYRFPYSDRTVELDIFPFWDDRAIAEVEMKSEDEKVILPPELRVIREVTGDRSYTNYSMAVPY